MFKDEAIKQFHESFTFCHRTEKFKEVAENATIKFQLTIESDIPKSGLKIIKKENTSLELRYFGIQIRIEFGIDVSSLKGTCKAYAKDNKMKDWFVVDIPNHHDNIGNFCDNYNAEEFSYIFLSKLLNQVRAKFPFISHEF